MNLNRMHTCGVTIVEIPSGNMSVSRQHKDGIALRKNL
jgi:hypothetical protein